MRLRFILALCFVGLRLWSADAPHYQLADDGMATVDKVNARLLSVEEDWRRQDFNDFWQPVKLTVLDYKNTNVRYRDIHNDEHQKTDVSATGCLYRFEITATFTPGKERILLEIPYSAFETTIYVARQQIAHYQLVYLPLETDITDFITPGKKVEITVRTLGYKNSALDNEGHLKFPVGATFHCSGGILGPMTINKVSAVRPTILVASPVKGLIKLETELCNQGRSHFGGNAEFQITDLTGKVIFKNSIANLKLKAGESRTVQMEFFVKDELLLWDIGKPNLYLAKISLHQNDIEIASRQVRFGYRYVELKGMSFCLNGRPIRLCGPWSHRMDYLKRNLLNGQKTPWIEIFRHFNANGINISRLHGMPFPEEFYNAADEAGFMVIAESTVRNTLPRIPDSGENYIRHFVRALRNHPSIVVWSASNEISIWTDKRSIEVMDYALRLQDIIHANDPSQRPVSHSGFGDAYGKLDIYNIHYPAEDALPRRFYWTREPEKWLRLNFRQNFLTYRPVGKKPIFYGEDLTPHVKRDTGVLFGEPGLRARFAALAGNRRGIEQANRFLGQMWKLHIRAAREQNIAMVSPNVLYMGNDSIFVQTISEERKPCGFYPVLCDPVFHAGKQVRLPVVAFEDAGFATSGMAKLWLEDENGTNISLYDQMQELFPGEMRQAELPLKMPNMPGKYILHSEWRNSNGEVSYQSETAVLIRNAIPPRHFDFVVQVMGRHPAWEQFIAKNGLKCQQTTWDKLVIGMVLVILPNVSDVELQKHAGDLSKFIARGGRMLVMEADRNENFLPGNSEHNPNGAQLGFIRRREHPALAGLDDLDFRYWDKDFMISHSDTFKGTDGNIRSLIDTGEELREQLLWEQRIGSGTVIVNHLDLLDNLPRRPQTELLLGNLLCYLDKFQVEAWINPTIIGGEKADPGAELFRQLSATSGQGKNLLVITAQGATTHSSEELISEAKKYCNIIALDLPRETVKRLTKALTGSSPKFQVQEPGKTSKVLFQYSMNAFQGDAPFYTGITSSDLNWSDNSGTIGYRFYNNSPWLGAMLNGKDCYFQGKDGGILLFLNLPFDRDVLNIDRRQRFTAQLLDNFNVQLNARPVGNKRKFSELFKPADLTLVANARRSHWFDKFPSGRQEFNGVIFQIPAEGATNANSIIRLSGSSRVKYLGVFDTPVDQFVSGNDTIAIPLPCQQVEALHLLIGATQNWKLASLRTGDAVAKLRIIFCDGTNAEEIIFIGDRIRAMVDTKSAKRATVALRSPITCNPEGSMGQFFQTRYLNPHPEKKIDRLEVESMHNPPFDLIIFAITVERTNLEFI